MHSKRKNRIRNCFKRLAHILGLAQEKKRCKRCVQVIEEELNDLADAVGVIKWKSEE